ncbi:hypothetical protein Taro_002316 [Colocasia esculenta]|uniref:Uncharacterized protein n=1 Tax=Colocasia esculenta TaxID=4460 RepID=A0A843TN91_COLES|nr:hypothetical protein [Colocasia esculenta]
MGTSVADGGSLRAAICTGQSRPIVNGQLSARQLLVHAPLIRLGHGRARIIPWFSETNGALLFAIRPRGKDIDIMGFTIFAVPDAVGSKMFYMCLESFVTSPSLEPGRSPVQLEETKSEEKGCRKKEEINGGDGAARGDFCLLIYED